MPTNRFVESSFWNFDSLFQPQSHPARDAHDTFFVSCAFVILVRARAPRGTVRLFAAPWGCSTVLCDCWCVCMGD